MKYGCEAWKLTKTEAKKLDAFQYKCMKRILRIRWPQTISHQQIQEITGMNTTSDEIIPRDHTSKMELDWSHNEERQRGTLGALQLEWRPEGRRRPGRQQTKWRRMVDDERQTAGWQSWVTVRARAAYCGGWKENVKALCVLWHGIGKT